MNLIPRLVLISLLIACAVAFGAWVLVSAWRKYVGHH